MSTKRERLLDWIRSGDPEDMPVLMGPHGFEVASAKLGKDQNEVTWDEAIAAAYDEAYGNLPAEPEFNASHILVETVEEAEALIVALNDGADFAELAKEKSTGPSGPNGGELGWFGLGMMVAPFEEAVLGLEVGQISGTVQTQFGWHVLILNDKRDVPPPALETVIGEITQTLQQVALDGKVNELRVGASVETMVEGIDPATIKNLELLDQ